MPIRRGWCRCRRPPSSGRSSSTRTAIESNKQAFLWGRRAAHDRAGRRSGWSPRRTRRRESHQLATTLEEMVARRVEFLTDYQNAAYAARYKALVERVARAEQERTPGRHGLAEAVARYYFKLLAYKDEYEVARLYTDGSFKKQIDGAVRGRLPPGVQPGAAALGREGSRHRPSEEARLRAVDADRVPAVGEAARACAAQPLDIFGYAAERKLERQLIADYERTDRRAARRPRTTTTTNWRSRSPASPSRSAAMAMSSRPIWSAPRRGRPNCWPPGARRRRPAKRRSRNVRRQNWSGPGGALPPGPVVSQQTE